VYKNETRAIRIPKNQLTFENIMKRLHDELKRPLILQYVDEEGDRITIRTNDELQCSIEYFKNKGKALKLDVQDDPSVREQEYEIPTESNNGLQIKIEKPKLQLKNETFYGKRIRWQKGELLGSGGLYFIKFIIC
jgi:hypothetical protein